MFRLLKVSGDSMNPVYKDGDFVFIFKNPYCLSNLKPGDTVIFKHQPYGLIIKMIERMDAASNEIFVVGLHPNSIDSRQMGPIRKQELVGKVICHIQRN
jgi:signal peptidase I